MRTDNPVFTDRGGTVFKQLDVVTVLRGRGRWGPDDRARCADTAAFGLPASIMDDKNIRFHIDPAIYVLDAKVILFRIDVFFLLRFGHSRLPFFSGFESAGLPDGGKGKFIKILFDE